MLTIEPDCVSKSETKDAETVALFGSNINLTRKHINIIKVVAPLAVICICAIVVVIMFSTS